VLNVKDHSRDSAGLNYIYPVVSRRSQGLSIGINLNTNNACNWACKYCQVPNLIRGAAPAINLSVLQSELHQFLNEVLHGDFMERRVPEDLRRLNDIAFSGNGEPTASPDFGEAVECVLNELSQRKFLAPIKLIVISNGSYVAKEHVLLALERLAGQGGELWFKLDRGTEHSRQHVNDIDLSNHLVLERLRAAASVIPVWLQTCLYCEDGMNPPDHERQAYIDLVGEALASGTQLQGIMLYTLARPSLQVGAERLSAMSHQHLETWALPLREMGLTVRVST
jgi:wyosine [tRNA(Phe)-imidazoG37] synthetase (radical SAM superfamily)